MYVTMYACMHSCMCMGEFVCMYIYTYIIYILYVLYIWGILLCYGGGGGTVVSVYSFCILYVLLFDDFLQ